MIQSSTAPVRAIACADCGKLMRVKSMPIDPTGRPALTFRMTCIKCNNSGNYTVHDVFVVGGRRN